jgi:hypothetical protein
LQPFSDNATSSTPFANSPPANFKSRHVEAEFEMLARLNSMSKRKTARPPTEPEIEENDYSKLQPFEIEDWSNNE